MNFLYFTDNSWFCVWVSKNFTDNFNLLYGLFCSLYWLFQKKDIKIYQKDPKQKFVTSTKLEISLIALKPHKNMPYIHVQKCK